MSDLTPIAPKLGKLIPRLATDSDGEVVATVRAIQRTLAAEGMDLHDLARAIETPRERMICAEAQRDQWQPRTWERLARWVVQHDCGRLQPHERKFARDMAARLVLRGEPSQKQGDWLRALYAKLGGEA